MPILIIQNGRGSRLEQMKDEIPLTVGARLRGISRSMMHRLCVEGFFKTAYQRGKARWWLDRSEALAFHRRSESSSPARPDR